VTGRGGWFSAVGGKAATIEQYGETATFSTGEKIWVSGHKKHRTRVVSFEKKGKKCG